MAALPERVTDDDRVVALADRLGMAPAPLVVLLGTVLVGLLARLLWLGQRVVHYDEGRVAYWALRYARTGQFEYRYIVHGPLIQHLDRWLFAVMGPSDFAMRLPVALVGAGLPLAALLFREHLSDWETAALAVFWAANPLLLYYSRFMRSDPLVATFAVVTLGALVRLYDTGRAAYLYAAAASFALAFASKENAVVYVLCWVGMIGLVAGLEVVQPRRVENWAALADLARDRVGAATETDPRDRLAWTGHAAGAVVLFLAVTFFMYAPRAGSVGTVGLYSSPLPAVLDATVSSLERGFEHWGGGGEGPPGCGSHRGEGQFVGKYLCNLGRELLVVGKAAATVSLLALAGVAAEFDRPTPRVLVPAAFYWGVASLLGYPIGSDILFPPWIAIHAVVPLAIPAAAGAVALAGWIERALAEGDPVSAVVTGALAVGLVTAMLGGAVHHSYVAPASSPGGEAAVVQFAQPEPMRGGVESMVDAGRDNEGVDLVVYDTSGGTFGLVDMGSLASKQPACVKWLRALPVSWYAYANELEVDCADNESTLEDRLESDPPVVVARGVSADDVRERLDDDYVSASYNIRQGTREVVVFYDSERVDPPPEASRSPE